MSVLDPRCTPGLFARARVAPEPEPVKARPSGRPKGRGLTARTLTEPVPSAERSLTSAGPKALPK